MIYTYLLICILFNYSYTQEEIFTKEKSTLASRSFLTVKNTDNDFDEKLKELEQIEEDAAAERIYKAALEMVDQERAKKTTKSAIGPSTQSLPSSTATWFSNSTRTRTIATTTRKYKIEAANNLTITQPGSQSSFQETDIQSIEPPAINEGEIYVMIAVHPLYARDVNILSDLAVNENYNFLTPPTVGGTTLILVSEMYKDEFLENLNNANIEYKIRMENAFKPPKPGRQRVMPVMSGEFSDDDNFDHHSNDSKGYKSFEEILGLLEVLAEHGVITLVELGNTIEGRPIVAAELMGPVTTSNIVILAGVYGREYMSVNVALYLIEHLLHLDEETKFFLKNTAVRIIPLLNPDGYTYAQSKDRYWHKNRKVVSTRNHNACYGVDLEKNFGKDEHGAVSHDSCSARYGGPNALSELESQALDAYLKEYSENTIFFLQLRSGNAFIGYPQVSRPNRKDVRETLEYNERFNLDLVQKMSYLMLAMNREEYYGFGSIEHFYGKYYTGAILDYVAAEDLARYQFVFSIEGGGNFGFDVPQDSINATSLAAFETIRLASKAVIIRMGFNETYLMQRAMSDATTLSATSVVVATYVHLVFEHIMKYFLKLG